MSLIKTSDGNAVDIYKSVLGAMPDIEKTMPEGCSLDVINESASFIEDSVNDTLFNIFLGVVLTSLVLFFSCTIIGRHSSSLFRCRCRSYRPSCSWTFPVLP